MAEASDVVRLAHRRINDGDIDGFIDLCSKRIRFQDVPDIPGSRLYQGPDEVREWVEGLREVSSDLSFTIWELEERDDSVLVECSADMTGAESGAAVGWRFWTVWRVKNSKITYHHGYSAKEGAVADFSGEAGVG